MMTNYIYKPEIVVLSDNFRTKIEIEDISTKLLNNLDFSSATKMCEVFSASGAVGIQALLQNQNISVDEYVSNVLDFETISENLKNNSVMGGVFPITALFSTDIKYDIVVIRTILEKRKTLIIKVALKAASILNDGGYLYLVGAKDEGIQSIARQLAEICGIKPETVIFKKGVHLIKFDFISAFKGQIISGQEPKYQEINIKNTSLKLVSEENIFAKGNLDPATKLLLENLEINIGDKVLDLGCGSGIIGLTTAKMARDVKVTLVDNDYLSVKITKQNTELNKISNCEVFVSDGIKAIKNKKFNCVVSNPPFHQGRKKSLFVAEQFIGESYEALSPKGRLYIVCNAFLPLEKTIKQVFGDATVIARNASYKVIHAIK